MLFTSAKHFVSRLTESEKIRIRLASDSEAQLDWIFFARHRSEIVGTDKAALKIFKDGVKLILDKFYKDCAAPTFDKTWSF